MKYIDYPVTKLKNKIYYIYDEHSHTYIAAKYDKKTGYFDTLYDKLSDVVKSYFNFPAHYSAIGTEFIMKEDIYKKAAPTYVVVRDPDSYYIEGVPHCKIFNLAPGETCLVGQHTIKRTSWAPYRFEVYVAGQQAPDLYYDTDKLYDYLMLEYPLM